MKPDIEYRFDEFIKTKSLKSSSPRKTVFRVFAGAKRHISVEELYALVKKENPKIGQATVYRALHLMCESGVARELAFTDGTTRYELQQGQEHHDHLICVQCGAYVEIYEPEIEKLQDKVFRKHRYTPEHHRMELYGVCGKCRK